MISDIESNKTLEPALSAANIMTPMFTTINFSPIESVESNKIREKKEILNAMFEAMVFDDEIGKEGLIELCM